MSYGEEYKTMTRIDGALAEAALKRAGYTEGIVEIGEWTESSGYCETCWSEDDIFAIFIDGENVYQSYAGYGSTIANFNDWLGEV